MHVDVKTVFATILAVLVLVALAFALSAVPMGFESESSTVPAEAPK